MTGLRVAGESQIFYYGSRKEVRLIKLRELLARSGLLLSQNTNLPPDSHSVIPLHVLDHAKILHSDCCYLR
jgi:hypothetical protein